MDKIDNSIQLNREIAYVGQVGRRREEFCLRYIRHKRELLKKFSKQQQEQASARGQTISCHIGCSFCCNEFIWASLQECESIVYYLYHRQAALATFINAFPSWLSQVQKHMDIIDRIKQAKEKAFRSVLSSKSVEVLGQEVQSYFKLQIACPFLSGGICSIYEVRPWVCASVFAVTPSVWCDPADRHEPRVYWTMFPANIELPFYDERTSLTLPSYNMPDTVYRILIGGFRFLSEAVGSKSLFQEVLNDEEVKRLVLRRYKRC